MTIKNNVVENNSKVSFNINNREKEVVLVEGNLIDPSNGKISVQSPLGKALLGKTIGEIFEFTTPSGKVVKIKINR